MIFEQYTNDQSRGLVFVSGGRSFPATDMKVTVPTGACWCLVALSLPFFQITRPRMPLRLSRRIDHSCCVWTLGWCRCSLVPERMDRWMMGRSNTWLGCVALYLPCNASVHGTSTHQHDRQKTNLLLCLFCSSLHRALLFVPATRGWHGLLLNLFRLGSDP